MSVTKYKYQFVKLHLDQFATFEENFDGAKDATIKIENKFEFGYNAEHKAVCCATHVNYLHEDKLILKAILNSYFVLHDDTVSELMQEDCLSLPPILLSEFASLCYGSLRGVLYAKTDKSPLEKIVLPPAYIGQIFDTEHKIRYQK